MRNTLAGNDARLAQMALLFFDMLPEAAQDDGEMVAPEVLAMRAGVLWRNLRDLCGEVLPRDLESDDVKALISRFAEVEHQQTGCQPIAAEVAPHLFGESGRWQDGEDTEDGAEFADEIEDLLRSLRPLGSDGREDWEDDE